MSHSKTEAHIPCKIKQIDILFIPKYILILLTEEIKDNNLEIEKVHMRHQIPYRITEYITLLLTKMVCAYQHS